MLLNRGSASSQRKMRADKVTGTLAYLTDLSLPDMLHAKVLRSEHPHALILSIRTERAKELPGVHAVITHADVPGINRFGWMDSAQPVFCEDRVRYIGDAIAAVAAESEEIAEKALRLIEVEYEPLPVIVSAEAGLLPSAAKLHPQGNVLHRIGYHKGDVEQAFADCEVIVRETYETPRQMHVYMETEGSVIVPEEDGGLTVYAGTRHGNSDCTQLSRILSIPESKIRIESNPIGGTFGCKDEFNVQPYGALLAFACKRPMKIHHSRQESLQAGLKKHPMKITMKTGTDGQGMILAHEVEILSDTGAYATFGPAVLDFALEYAIGPYRISNVDVRGTLVYTNNGVSGEFRGFGGNQITFALEGQIDRLAAKLDMDPWELRKLNIRDITDEGPLGQRIAPTNGMKDAMKAISQSPLWAERENSIRQKMSADAPSSPSWLRTGYGAAITMHGSEPETAAGSHFLYSFAVVLAKTEVDLRTGRVRVLQLDHAVAAGPVLNPADFQGQIEGAAVMGLGFTLTENTIMEQGYYITRNLDTYLIPSLADAPIEMNVYPVEQLEEDDSHGPRDVGEIGMIAVAPAIASAVFDAIGVQVTTVPISPEELIGSLSVLMP
ncbi:molybdopterin cofactor-binding domain-containing protein [Paenibacillus sp. GP183]|jgi:CO/xanthine dehydrogenase Mo-binding subunit|uniref:molybdopterin cofactor-binding domain-containing protein n=1 Tax=Paenibacillus sp. GP183 TaxID=1882751 RepID=UPI0008958501|nr:molybdopterin cofactor-binding domain-containing protein [Paenibacillus sp. GP183]SEB55938.1 Molybdopterin-binding domain of aldehyde dehydrogenase [Paenibacillus sp. GP183]